MRTWLVLGFVCLFGTSIQAQDAIDPGSIQVVGGSPDVRHWAVTATVTRVTLWSGNLEVIAPAVDGWPQSIPPGWDGPIQYTLWLVVQKDGVWRTTGSLEFWKGKTQTGSPLSSALADWYYYAPEIGQPQPGDVVGLFLANGDQRRKDVRIVEQRTNIVAFKVPANDAGNFEFAAVPPSVPPPVVTPPPVVIPPPPVVTPPPPIVVPPPDLSGVTGRLEALAQQLATHEAQSATRQQELKAAIDNPGYITKILGNRYVQMALAGVGTYFTTRQMVQP